MVKNPPICWGDYYNRQNPELQKEKEKAYKKYNIEFPILPDCSCRLIKSCIRRYNKLSRIITNAINNPRSR